MIYGILLNIPEKYAPKYEDIIRKVIGEGIAKGDILSFTEGRYDKDVAFVMLAKSRKAAQRVYESFKEHPIYVKIIEIEGKGD